MFRPELLTYLVGMDAYQRPQGHIPSTVNFFDTSDLVKSRKPKRPDS